MYLMLALKYSGQDYQKDCVEDGVLRMQSPQADPPQALQALWTWRWQEEEGTDDSVLDCMSSPCAGQYNIFGAYSLFTSYIFWKYLTNPGWCISGVLGFPVDKLNTFNC